MMSSIDFWKKVIFANLVTYEVCTDNDDIHLLFTRNGSNKNKEIQKKKNKKYTNIKSESTKNQFANKATNTNIEK